jgi:hypothetical protein
MESPLNKQTGMERQKRNAEADAREDKKRVKKAPQRDKNGSTLRGMTDGRRNGATARSHRHCATVSTRSAQTTTSSFGEGGREGACDRSKSRARRRTSCSGVRRVDGGRATRRSPTVRAKDVAVHEPAQVEGGRWLLCTG